MHTRQIELADVNGQVLLEPLEMFSVRSLAPCDIRSELFVQLFPRRLRPLRISTRHDKCHPLTRVTDPHILLVGHAGK